MSRRRRDRTQQSCPYVLTIQKIEFKIEKVKENQKVPYDGKCILAVQKSIQYNHKDYKVELALRSLFVDENCNRGIRAYMTVDPDSVQNGRKFGQELIEHAGIEISRSVASGRDGGYYDGVQMQLIATTDAIPLFRYAPSYGRRYSSRDGDGNDRNYYATKAEAIKEVLREASSSTGRTIGGLNSIDFMQLEDRILVEAGFQRVPDVFQRAPDMWAGNASSFFQQIDYYKREEYFNSLLDFINQSLSA